MIRYLSARRILTTATGVALLSGSLAMHRADAQQTAVVTGRVAADSGGPIRHAGIRIPTLERVTTADTNGAFRIEQLAPARTS